MMQDMSTNAELLYQLFDTEKRLIVHTGHLTAIRLDADWHERCGHLVGHSTSEGLPSLVMIPLPAITSVTQVR